MALVSGAPRNSGSNRAANTIVFAGDSITARGRVVNAGAGPITNDTRGYWCWANMLLGHRLKILNVAGINGDTIDGLTARLVTDVLAYNPAWASIEIGVNNIWNSTDSSQSLSIAQIKTKLTGVYVTLLNAGIRVIAHTITPHNGSSSSQNLTMNQVNNWLRDYCTSTPGMHLVDGAKLVIDPASATNNWMTGNLGSPDGLHPYSGSAARWGREMFDLLDPLVPKLDRLDGSGANTDNLLANPWFNGTLGAGVATSWTLSAGAGTIAAGSDYGSTFGTYGAGQQQQVLASTVLTTQLYQDVSTGFAVGDTLVAGCKFVCPSAWASVTRFRLRVLAYQNSVGPGTPTIQTIDMDNGSLDTWPLENQPGQGVFRTPAVLLPVTTDRVRVIMEFVGQGQVNWIRPFLKKV